jgi:DNA-binding transcriptional LysR family regulator
MRLRQLRFMVAVVEEGSFTAAANRVHATQSGVSAQIKLLEESLNTKLFDRSASGVVPTATGRVVYQRATRVLRETTAMIADVSALNGTVTGQVSAGLMPSTTRSVAAPVLESFATLYPNIEVRIEEAYSAHLSEGVRTGRLDFAVVPPATTEAGLKTTPLETDAEVFVTAPTDQRDHLSPVDLTRLEPLKLVLPGPENARRASIEEMIRHYDIRVERVMELDAMMATLDLVARGDWTTILPGCLVIGDLPGNERQLHPIVHPPMSLDYVLIEQASRTLSPAAQLLCEAMRDELAAICEKCRTAFVPADKK